MCQTLAPAAGHPIPTRLLQPLPIAHAHTGYTSVGHPAAAQPHRQLARAPAAGVPLRNAQQRTTACHLSSGRYSMTTTKPQGRATDGSRPAAVGGMYGAWPLLLPACNNLPINCAAATASCWHASCRYAYNCGDPTQRVRWVAAEGKQTPASRCCCCSCSPKVANAVQQPPTLLTTLPACTADTWRRHASKSEHPLRAAAATTAAAAAGDQPRPASRHFKQADDSCTGGCSCCRHRCCCRPHRRRKERGLCVRVNTDTHSPPPCAQYLSLWAFTMAATSGTP
jgi:hypothetical protein